MLPIKHNKKPFGKGWEAHLTVFSMEHLGLVIAKTVTEAWAFRLNTEILKPNSVWRSLVGYGFVYKNILQGKL
jgi:hypothetical protein